MQWVETGSSQLGYRRSARLRIAATRTSFVHSWAGVQDVLGTQTVLSLPQHVCEICRCAGRARLPSSPFTNNLNQTMIPTGGGPEGPATAWLVSEQGLASEIGQSNPLLTP